MPSGYILKEIIYRNGNVVKWKYFLYNRNVNKHEHISKWLDKKYREWQNNEGESKPLIQFATYLDVNYTLLSRWLNNRQLPANENVIKIGNKLGFEIYDLLGWIRPEDPK